MTALGLLIPAAAAGAIIWRIQSKRGDDGTGLLAGTRYIPAVLLLCAGAFMTFIALVGKTN